jgi:hypothetical protein
LFGDADRVMQWKNVDGGSHPDMTRACVDIGEHQIGAGKHPQSAEVMLADPGRMEAHRRGIDCLVDDVGDEVVRAPGVVVVVVVAQREIAEFHVRLPNVAIVRQPIDAGKLRMECVSRPSSADRSFRVATAGLAY